jgi:hypothetical protein
MRIKDIHPNTIYKYVGNTKRAGFWFRTGDSVVAQPSPRSESPKAPSNHLLIQSDLTGSWNPEDGEAARYVDHVEVLRWVDNERMHGLHNGDQTLDLTFQPQPFQHYSDSLSTYRDPFLTDEEAEAQYVAQDDDNWVDPWPAKREALIAEWGTERYWNVPGGKLPGSNLRSLGDYVGTIPLAGIEGPYDEATKAAAEIVLRAELVASSARHAERSKVREAQRTEARSFLVTTLANVPDALVENTSNGLPRDVEEAQYKGTSGWSLDYEDGYRGEVNTTTPDGGTLVGLKASTLAAITYAWQQVYGDASWEDIAAGVYERFHESDEVKHLGIKVPATEDVEAVAVRVAQYLPANYEVVGTETYRTSSEVLVKGTDVAGWTADGYVIPRLATGLLVAEVYSLSRQAVSA